MPEEEEEDGIDNKTNSSPAIFNAFVEYMKSFV